MTPERKAQLRGYWAASTMAFSTDALEVFDALDEAESRLARAVEALRLLMNDAAANEVSWSSDTANELKMRAAFALIAEEARVALAEVTSDG